MTMTSQATEFRDQISRILAKASRDLAVEDFVALTEEVADDATARGDARKTDEQ